MRINNRYVGTYMGRPLLDDSTIYNSVIELRNDYERAIADFDKHELHTFPTVELDGEEYYAVRVFYDTFTELTESVQAVLRPEVNVALFWHRDNTMYYLVKTEDDENVLLSAIAELFGME